MDIDVHGAGWKLVRECFQALYTESEKNGHNVGTAVIPEKRFFFSSFYSFFYIYFFNFNSQCPIHPTVGLLRLSEYSDIRGSEYKIEYVYS